MPLAMSCRLTYPGWQGGQPPHGARGGAFRLPARPLDMRRDLARLANDCYDLLIVGGGIHGACAAWDAVLRGLSVALVDKGDFGAATSANSLRIIHGGLRYLQQADLGRMRESIGERSTLLRIAPHLVRPLPVLVPTYGHGASGKAAHALALWLTDVVGFDRNRFLAPERRLPGWRLVSRDECLDLFPGFDRRRLSGGALWYDAQMTDSERLTLAFLRSATERGAAVANYVRAERLLCREGAVHGARVVDGPTGQPFEIQARAVLNATGPWAEDLLGAARLGAPAAGAPTPMALAVNLVTRGVVRHVAVGVRSRRGRDDDPGGGGRRFLFLVPWRGSTLVGTSYRVYRGRADDCRPTEADLQALLDEVNEASPSLGLALSDVTFYHRGLLPLGGEGAGRGRPALASHARIVDHEARDGLRGLVSMVGVKFTTARRVAQDAIDLVLAKLGQPARASRSAEVPLYGADAAGPDPMGPGLLADAPGPRSARKRLASVHGTRALEVAAGVRDVPGWADPVAPGAGILRGEVVHAVREEMALTLADVALRRTGLGAEGCPPPGDLRAAAELMGQSLGWDERRAAREVEDVLALYAPIKV